MKAIIGIDSFDDATKTRYIDELKKQNPNLVDIIHLCSIKDVYKIYHDTNDIEMFCEKIYKNISEKINFIKSSNKPVVIVENSLYYVDSIVENLILKKGLLIDNIKIIIEKYKSKYQINDISDHIILLSNNTDNQILNENKQYLLCIKNDLDNINNKFTSISNEENISLVVNRINETISNVLENKVQKINGDRYIFGIGGLSESGKSSTGRILLHKYNIPNFKFNYVNDVVMKTYGLNKNDSLFNNNIDFVAILVIDEIVNLLNRMYYWEFVSFESLHDYKLTNKMKEILPKNFIVLFLKTDDIIRTNRNALDLNNNYEKSELEIEKKDKVKKSRGADQIENIANFVINNNGIVEELEKKLYNIVKYVKEGNLKMRNRAGGLLIENGKVLLMHRIKNIEGVVKEYYVVPGGGIEDGENIEIATKRELKEEIGIDVELANEEPLFTLEQENGNQYFSIINRISGEIGTGTGPEFSDPNYANRGVYSAEMISIQDIIDGKINMVPEVIKEEFINVIKDLNMDINDINSDTLSQEKSKMLKELQLK